MKKLLALLPLLLIASVTGAQTLDEIINKNSRATGTELLEKAKTIYVEGKAVQMGMEMPMKMYMKQPDKIKVVVTYNGMEIITLFDGQKGYMVNPLMGSTEPVEVPQEQLGNIKGNNMFHNQLLDNFKAGKLSLMGSEDVNGKPAFKIMATVEGGTPIYFFVDKESYLTVKTTTTVNQMGQDMEVESYIKEYHDINGIKFPKVTVSFVNGSEMGSTSLDKVEIDKPIEDSVFTLSK